MVTVSRLPAGLQRRGLEPEGLTPDKRLCCCSPFLEEEAAPHPQRSQAGLTAPVLPHRGGIFSFLCFQSVY